MVVVVLAAEVTVVKLAMVRTAVERIKGEIMKETEPDMTLVEVPA